MVANEYAVKCDECKKTIRETSDVKESYAGGVCLECEAADSKRKDRNAKARARRAAMRDVMESCGMVRVRGAMGGIYYE